MTPTDRTLKQFVGWLRRPIVAAGFQDLRDYEGHLLSTAFRNWPALVFAI
jgi:hypothetical protein